MVSAQERLKLLARSWTIVAEGYDRSFSSRFAHWQREAIAELQAALPAGGHGTIAVPACGPGRSRVAFIIMTPCISKGVLPT